MNVDPLELQNTTHFYPLKKLQRNLLFVGGQKFELESLFSLGIDFLGVSNVPALLDDNTFIALACHDYILFIK